MSLDLQSAQETERIILGAALLNGEVRDLVIQRLSPEMFVEVNNAKLFNALCKLSRNETPIDAMGLLREARAGRTSQLDDAVLDADFVETVIKLGRGVNYDVTEKSHIPAVIETYRLRRFEALCGEVFERIVRTSSADLGAFIQSSVDAILGSTDDSSVVPEWRAIWQALDESCDKRDPLQKLGPLTCIRELDEMNFRLTPREMVTIAGRPSQGKTSLAIELAVGASTQVGVGYFALEDGVKAFADRRIANIIGVHGEEVRAGNLTPKHNDILGSYVHVAADRPLYIVDNNVSLSASDIVARTRLLKRKEPTLGVIVIDQCYDVEGWNTARKGESRDQSPTRIIDEILRGCRTLDVCPVFVQQLNRNAADKLQHNSEPTLSDLSETDAFAKRSRKVVFVWRPNFIDNAMEAATVADDPQYADNVAKIKIAKWTNGVTGMMDVPWDGKRYRIGTFRDPYLRAAVEDYKRNFEPEQQELSA